MVADDALAMAVAVIEKLTLWKILKSTPTNSYNSANYEIDSGAKE